MFKAYIKTDPLEDPEVLNDLIEKLLSFKILPVITSQIWKDIWETQPFLYFRNAYIRFTGMKEVAKLHLENPDIPYMVSQNQEIISVNPAAKGCYPFKFGTETYYHEPKIESLPVLIGTNHRPVYFRLTLNSILANLKSQNQKIYIVVSDPDPETKKIVEDLLNNNKFDVEAVLSPKNLSYAFNNFGTKFFKLKKLIQHEDDGIIPENTHYYIPFYTKQLNHRSTTSHLVTFRVFEGNWRPDFFTCDFYHKNKLMDLPPPNKIWHYFKPKVGEITPLGGHGIVINSETMYKNFGPPNYNATDEEFINQGHQGKQICLINLPVYHIGANYMMDYPEYSKNKTSTVVDRIQTGINMRTGETQKVDLGVDWKDGGIIK